MSPVYPDGGQEEVSGTGWGWHRSASAAAAPFQTKKSKHIPSDNLHAAEKGIQLNISATESQQPMLQ